MALGRYSKKVVSQSTRGPAFSTEALAKEDTSNVEILKHSFERWLAQVDKGSEKG